ncbi:organic cation transporter protein-like [Epargyreus clarus]|uniref:organic cation transporter protein-like n=1 Tax=Epargyreus clarus TaxID=520877 RepID=UPI003C2DBB70
MANEKEVGLDEVLKKLGPFGRYTVFNYAFVLVPVFLAGFFGSAYNFEALDIKYRCEIPECEGLNHTLWLENAIPQEKGELSRCKMYQYINGDDSCSAGAFNTSVVQECDSYVYTDQGSVVKEFDLGCQNWKRTLIGSIHNAGFFVALPLTGFISDKYGRTIALSIASLMNGIFGIARSFSTSYTMLLVFEFLEASLGAGHFTTSFVMAMELVGPRGRVFGNTMINFVYVSGMVTLAGLAWYLQNWRHLLRVIFTPAFFVVSYFLFLKESPRWLISKGRYEEAIAVLRNAAKMNRVDIPEEMLKPQNFVKNTQEDTKTSDNKDEIEKKPSLFMQVIKSRIIVTRLVICSYMWMSCTFIYYGLSINSVSLAGNKYLNFMLVAMVEIPANIMCLIVLDRFGRKRVITVTYVLSGCLCISLSTLPKDQVWWSFVLYLSGKFCITVTYSSTYIYVSEVFPTTVRQSLLGFCSTMGRFGTTLAPLTPLLGLYYDNLPAIFFGSVALIASILIYKLPETINVKLPDTIEEAEEISRRNNKENNV